MNTHPGNPRASRLERTLDFLMRGGIILILVLAPLPFGSVEAWAYSVLELTVALLGLIFIYRSFLFPSTRIVFSPLLLAPLGFICLMGLQLLPLPRVVLETISSSSAALYDQTVQGYSETTHEISATDTEVLGHSSDHSSTWRPLSLVPVATWTYLLKGIAITGFLFLLLNVFRETRQVRLSLYALVGTGTAEAFYGLLEYLTGHQHIFNYQKKYYLEAATGTFINRNHFALFLEMSLLVALGLLFSRLRASSKEETWRERVLGLTDRRASLNLTLVLCIAILTIALILSYSRAGIVLGLAAAGTFSLLQLRRGWSLKKTILISFLAVAIFIPAYGVGYWTLTGRYAVLTDEFSAPGGRLAVWKGTAGIVRDFRYVGSGVGTFQYVFPRYRQASITAFYDYTHNDYLQVLSETGLAGGVLLIAGLVAVARTWLLFRQTDPERRVIFTGCGLGALAVGLHEFVDFGLQIPANLFAITFVVGALALIAQTAGSSSDREPGRA